MIPFREGLTKTANKLVIICISFYAGYKNGRICRKVYFCYIYCNICRIKKDIHICLTIPNIPFCIAIFSKFISTIICKTDLRVPWHSAVYNKTPFHNRFVFFSNQILLPLGGLLIAVFAGWFMRREDSRDELDSLSAGIYSVWYFLIRFVVPPALLVIFVMGISE